MRRRLRESGLEAEVLASLALVMGLATLVLVTVFAVHQESLLRRTLGRALAAEARAANAMPLHPGTDWWWIDAQGGARPRAGQPGPPDAELMALAEAARERGVPLLRPGAPNERIRFAMPIGADGRVAAARMPKNVSFALRVFPLGVVASLALANVGIFTAFGALLLRRRVVRPLQGLADGAGRIAEGESGLRLSAEGPAEIQGLATAFNEMTEALEGRSTDLAKAVVDLRRANRELRDTRDDLDRAERLAAVGSLAAGVAHEVGNPMGALLTYLELAGRDAGLSDAGRDHLDRARGEGERVRRILRQLLDFSRPARAVPVPLDLARVAEDARALALAQERARGVRVELTCDDALPPVRGDEGILVQILLNLVLNAVDAVEGADAPVIALFVRAAAGPARASEHGADGARARREADAVECVVADNGCGIPVEDRERIFAPFYTTKDPGRGTGLGLTNAARLAEESNGRLGWIEPPDGFVTAFCLRLPCHPGAAEESARVRSG